MRVCPTCHLRYQGDGDRCLVDGAVLEVQPDPRIGQVLAGRYVLEEVIGEGGMATVYRARHQLVERPCAVKILHDKFARDAEVCERLRREARAAAAVAHPNVIEVFDLGETEDGAPFLVMELLAGETLRHRIEQGPIPSTETVELAVQIARGLARAHDLKVVHRDLKPENVFLIPSEGGPPVVKIVDFGLARSHREGRLTASGQVVGTPSYMAPERIVSGDEGPSADLYALGIVLFEMLTGRLPFLGKNLGEMVLMHLQETPPVPSSLVDSLPPELEELVLSLLEKDVARRPVDAHVVVRQLEAMLPRGHRNRHRASRPSTISLLPEVSVTLDRWNGRAALFQEMVRRAYGRSPPREALETLGQIQAAVARLAELHATGLAAQRELEGLEQEAREGRERLGHAVHELGIDLSAARDALRQDREAQQDNERGAKDARQAFEEADLALAPLRSGGDGTSAVPTAAHVDHAQRMAESVARWKSCVEEAAGARERQETGGRRVADLEFQVAALVEQLVRLEATFDERAAGRRAALKACGDERAAIEQNGVKLAERFCEPLRVRPELADLFRRLDGRPSIPAPAAVATRR